ncbi:MAG: hypothetical protein ACK4RV_00850 [Caulobacter sp.]|jgi:hypothetical protein
MIGMARLAGLTAAAFLFAGGAAAQTGHTLADGRTLSLPASFEGCSGDWAQSTDDARIYNAACGPTAAMAIAILGPGGWATPQELVKLAAEELGANGDLYQVVPMQMKGGKVMFVCRLDDDSSTQEGLAICTAQEPVARFSIMATGDTNAQALERVRDLLLQVTVR